MAMASMIVLLPTMAVGIIIFIGSISEAQNVYQTKSDCGDQSIYFILTKHQNHDYARHPTLITQL